MQSPARPTPDLDRRVRVDAARLDRWLLVLLAVCALSGDLVIEDLVGGFVAEQIDPDTML